MDNRIPVAFVKHNAAQISISVPSGSSIRHTRNYRCVRLSGPYESVRLSLSNTPPDGLHHRRIARCRTEIAFRNFFLSGYDNQLNRESAPAVVVDIVIPLSIFLSNRQLANHERSFHIAALIPI